LCPLVIPSDAHVRIFDGPFPSHDPSPPLPQDIFYLWVLFRHFFPVSLEVSSFTPKIPNGLTETLREKDGSLRFSSVASPGSCPSPQHKCITFLSFLKPESIRSLSPTRRPFSPLPFSGLSMFLPLKSLFGFPWRAEFSQLFPNSTSSLFPSRSYLTYAPAFSFQKAPDRGLIQE